MRVFTQIGLGLLGLLLLGCNYLPSRTCETHRIGEFTATTIIDGQSFTTNFERFKTLQVERYGAQVDSFEIKWINKCEFTLINKNPKNRYEAKANHIKLLTTTDSSYTFEFSVVGDHRKFKGVAIKK